MRNSNGRWAGGLIFIGFLLTNVPLQAAPWKPVGIEPLETMGDSPMRIFRTGISERMVAVHGGYTSYQVNVDASEMNITGDAANEPSITVDPTNHNRMAIGWRQFNSSVSNFRQAGWGYTTNGGMTWTFPGVLEANVFRSDPVLFTDDTGKFFYLSLLENFYDDLWRSLNGGGSWFNLGPATGGDKQWVTIDNTASSGHGFLYQSWSTAGNNYGGRQFSRSTDGGASWEAPVNIPNSLIWGTLDVDTGGNLFLGGINPNTGQFFCERSTSAKIAAVSPTFEQVTPVDLGGHLGVSQPINPVGLVGQTFLAVDRSGTSSNNNVYLLASVLPTDAAAGSDVIFARSTDGGASFSAPIRINDDGANTNRWHWLATLSVAPNGRLDAVWLDTRNAANNSDSQLYYSYSLDAGTTWSANVAVSAAFNPFLGYPDQQKIGDYLTSVSDNEGADVAYPATFNGEEDVYYVRVTPPLSQQLNISTRALVLTGDQRTIAGFIITGSAPKRVIIRGVGGASLRGVSGTLADPTLELHQGSATLMTNDNWKTRSDGSSQEAEVVATGLAPMNDLESVIVTTLNPGTYSVVLAGNSSTTGVGLVEVYDLSAASGSVLANLSTRAYAGTGDEVLIGGFIIGGGGGARVLVRTIGPSLAGPVQGALADPTVELHDANGTTTATNDNWKVDDQSGQSQEGEVRATNLAPTNDLESAILTTLAPGAHTAVVRGRNGGVGVALVEVYRLP
ncbi:MAG: hypothetical protein ACR2NX_08330 [Chthoniobacterales bacterium]